MGGGLRHTREEKGISLLAELTGKAEAATENLKPEDIEEDGVKALLE